MVKTLLSKKITPGGFTCEFIPTFKEESLLIFCHLFQKTEKEGIYPNSFLRGQMLNPNGDTIRKKLWIHSTHETDYPFNNRKILRYFVLCFYLWILWYCYCHLFYCSFLLFYIFLVSLPVSTSSTYLCHFECFINSTLFCPIWQVFLFYLVNSIS